MEEYIKTQNPLLIEKFTEEDGIIKTETPGTVMVPKWVWIKKLRLNDIPVEKLENAIIVLKKGDMIAIKGYYEKHQWGYKYEELKLIWENIKKWKEHKKQNVLKEHIQDLKISAETKEKQEIYCKECLCTHAERNTYNLKEIKTDEITKKTGYGYYIINI